MRYEWVIVRVAARGQISVSPLRCAEPRADCHLKAVTLEMVQSFETRGLKGNMWPLDTREGIKEKPAPIF